MNDNLQSQAVKPLQGLEDFTSKSEGPTYSEIPGLLDPSLDVLNQLNANMKILKELHDRLQFTFKEVKYVLQLK